MKLTDFIDALCEYESQGFGDVEVVAFPVPGDPLATAKLVEKPYLDLNNKVVFICGDSDEQKSS